MGISKKRATSEASANVENEWSYTSITSRLHFMFISCWDGGRVKIWSLRFTRLLTYMFKVDPVIFAPRHEGGGGITPPFLNLGNKIGEIGMLVGMPLKQSTLKI